MAKRGTCMNKGLLEVLSTPQCLRFRVDFEGLGFMFPIYRLTFLKPGSLSVQSALKNVCTYCQSKPPRKLEIRLTLCEVRTQGCICCMYILFWVTPPPKKKLETGIPYTLLLRVEAVGCGTSGLLLLGSPVVPFYPVSFWVPLLKPNSRKKGALIIKGLLGNLDYSVKAWIITSMGPSGSFWELH